MNKILKAVGSIFKPKMPDVPSFKMPVADNFGTQREALKKVRERSKRGREGTIYTGGTPAPFTGTNLGGTA